MSDERLCEPEFSLDTNDTPVIIQQIYNLALGEGVCRGSLHISRDLSNAF